MTRLDCEKYIVCNVQHPVVPAIGKIPHLNRTNSPKCIGNRSFSGTQTCTPAKGTDKCLPGREMHHLLGFFNTSWKAQLLRTVIIPPIFAQILKFL